MAPTEGENKWRERAEKVKDAVRRAWEAYLKNGYPSDDLRPVTSAGDEWLHNHATVVDSLDTLYLVGLRKEFSDAVKRVARPAGFIYPVTVFEYHLRGVGGLLGAYSLSGRKELLQAARRAADAMIHAAFTVKGFPVREARIVTPSGGVMSAIGSLLGCSSSCTVISNRLLFE